MHDADAVERAFVQPAGGILSELLQDVSGRLAPVGLPDAEQVLSSLRAKRLLDGYPGAAPVPLAGRS